jgi:hypothetical protein
VVFVPLGEVFLAGDGTMANTNAMDREYRSPLRKLVRFFEVSRDQWKAKHHTVKTELKLEQNQRRAVERSRAKWRAKAEDAQQRLRDLELKLQQQQKS